LKLAALLKAAALNDSKETANRTPSGERSAAAVAYDHPRAPDPEMGHSLDIDIQSIHYNSREERPGGLFVAITGFAADGHDYIHDAVERGAVAVITQKPVACPVMTCQVENTRKALGAISDAFYNHPSGRLHITGITGTNGKTTTAYLIESMLASAGMKVGVIGTVNYRYGGNVFDNPVTTPESLDLQRILAEMVLNGTSHVVMEVSSHAIDLFRINGCDMDVGVFTNLTQDHLDYHGSMENYWRCKKNFFTHHLAGQPLKDSVVAVVNIDNVQGKELAAAVPYPCITVGNAEESMVKSGPVQIDLNGIRGELMTPDGPVTFASQLIGSHNLENILCATGTAVALGLPLDVIKTGIEKTPLVPGRLEHVCHASGKSVYVDYAHTPDALKNVLRALKRLNPARLICVFGCGGDRDKAKRPQMGEIAGTLCDLVIVTSDNPRTEAPGDIIDQVLTGVRRACPHEFHLSDIQKDVMHKGYWAESDRRQAIRTGIRAARPGDIVLIAGKGHETYQLIGSRRIPFDDRIEAANALAAERSGTARNKEMAVS